MLPYVMVGKSIYILTEIDPSSDMTLKDATKFADRFYVEELENVEGGATGGYP